MSHPTNITTVYRGGAPVVVVTLAAGTHQGHSPQPPVGSLFTHPVAHASTNTLLVAPGMLMVPHHATVTPGTGMALILQANPPQLVQASDAYAPQSTSHPTVRRTSGRSTKPLPSSSAYSSPRPPRPPMSVPPSNPPYRASYDNSGRADSRGFHYVKGQQSQRGANGGLQTNHNRNLANSRAAAGTQPVVVDADRRGRDLVGSEYYAGGAPIPRKYLDVAWGLTPSTKKSLGLTD